MQKRLVSITARFAPVPALPRLCGELQRFTVDRVAFHLRWHFGAARILQRRRVPDRPESCGGGLREGLRAPDILRERDQEVMRLTVKAPKPPNQSLQL